MAGSWEIRNNTSVLLYTLHTEQTTIAWAYGLRALMLPGHVMGLSGMPFDMARNMACQRCLEGGYDWLMSLDSDVIPPPDTVHRLLARKQPIVSGLYCRRSPPHAIPVMIKDGAWVTRFAPGSLVEVDLVGAGCLLVHRSVLERCPPQRPGHRWFDWRVNYQGVNGEDGKPLFPVGACLSEDFTWCQHVRKNGHRIFCDTSVICRHVGMAEATYNSYLPLNSNPM